MAYNKKVVISGNVIEVYEYLEPIKEGYSNKIEKTKREQDEEVKKENFARSIKRTSKKIRELVNCNFDNDNSSFLTLTFKDNITDYDVAFSSWKRFKQKVERKYKIKLSYLGVVEFQKRGAIHFHICLFNVPYLKHSELYDLWLSVTNGGGVYIEKVNTEECDNVGAYVTKYITKDSDDFFDNEYKGKKRYFTSRNLKEPTEIKYSPDMEEDFNNFMNGVKDNIVYEYTSKPFDITKKVPINDLLGDTFGYEKEKTVEQLVATQQLKYTQVLIKLNKDNRDLNNKYIYKYNKEKEDNQKNIKKII